jgi:hypothetical protein
MGLKAVVFSIALILLISLIIPFFADISRDSTVQRVQLEAVEIKAERVNDSHVDITFLISIYRTKVLTNASLTVSVYDRETKLLLQRHVLQIPERGAEGTAELNTTLPFDKSRDYNIAFKLEKDRRFIDYREMSLRGLDTLHPPEKELKMSLKDVDFQILNVTEGRVVVKARFYVETLEDYDDTVFHIKAVQFESGVLADEKWLNVAVKSGKTLLAEVNLTLPENYNYLVKIEVWRNQSLLKTWSKGLNLSPTKQVPETVSEEKVRFEATEFIKRPPEPLVGATRESLTSGVESKSVATPGFNVIIFLTAVGGAAIWKRKHRKNTP